MASSCGSCGGGGGGRTAGASSPRKGLASRNKALPWVHTSPRGAVARYKTEPEARSAMKVFGGSVEERTGSA